MKEFTSYVICFIAGAILGAYLVIVAYEISLAKQCTKIGRVVLDDKAYICELLP